jgi:Tfp pilus assembly protein PilN
LVTNAGLKFVSATPVDAAVMARLAVGAMKRRGQHSGLLYIGERRSFFLIVNDGSLVFARPIGLGIEALVTSLTRPLRAIDGKPAIELNIESARAILHKFGFPRREEIVHAELGVTGGQLIPLLQPVLQRYIVELRQSLRFGLPEEERQSVIVQFTGPGSSIPGFAELVSKELGLKIDIDPKYAEFDGVQVGAVGSELVDAVADVSLLSRMNLQPRAMARRAESKRFRRWLWTGAAAALAWVATDAIQMSARVSDLRRETESITSRADELQSLQVAGKKLMESIDAMKELETIIASQMGSSVNFRAALFEIANLSPASVRLTDIKFNTTDGRTAGSIAGYAYPDDASGRRTELETFISHLRGSPLFDDVSLHNVQMGDTKAAGSQSFEVSLVCVAGPDSDSPMTTAAASTEALRP